MTTYPNPVNEDVNGIKTAAEYGDRGDGNTSWYQWVKIGAGTIGVSASNLEQLVKTEDAAHASGDKGIMSLAVRSDTPAALAGTTGDYIPLITDSSGRLWIRSATAFAEDVAHVTGDLGQFMLAVRNDTPTALAGTTLDYIPLTTDSLGRLWARLGSEYAEDSAHVSGDLGAFVQGVINATLAARAADGDYAPFALGLAGEQYVTPSVSGAVANSAPTNSTSTAYETNRVVKATPGTLFGLSGYNSLASTQFIQVHNATSLPSDGAVPSVVISVPASSNFSIDFGSYGRRFSTGIVVCNSSTGPTKTIGAANLWIDAQYL